MTGRNDWFLYNVYSKITDEVNVELVDAITLGAGGA